MKNFKIVIFTLIICLQAFFLIHTNYPPSFEQINLGINNSFLLWITRIFSLGFLLLSTQLLSKTIKGSAFYYWFFVFISPLPTVLAMSNPIICFIILSITLLYYFSYKRTLPWPIALPACFVILILINQVILKQHFHIWQSLSLSNAQIELADRFSKEDSLTDKVYLPLEIRRLAYNKYNIALKNTASDVLNFFDVETVFFTEVHPLLQKSIVIFYWPEIVIFFVSLIILFRSKNSLLKQSLGFLFLASLLVYLFTDSQIYVRLALLLWTISLLLNFGVNELLKTKFKFVKMTLIIVLAVSFYGFINNQYDMYKRPLVWLDNKPSYYDWLFRQANVQNYLSYKKVYLVDTFGLGNEYCEYYLTNCEKITFEDSPVTKESAEADSLYLGFQNSLNQIQLLNTFTLNDNIANSYGQTIIVGIIRK